MVLFCFFTKTKPADECLRTGQFGIVIQMGVDVCCFLEKKENIVFLGSSGVGKTHLATAVGIAAAKKRTSTHFIKCHELLIIDELGYLPINKEDSNLFFQLTDMRYEKKSTIITTNINFGDWESIFYDSIVANAILDRVLHHATVVTITAKSYRIKDHIKYSE